MNKIKISETDIQSAIIRYLTVLENQGKLFFNRTNNIPPVNKDHKGKEKIACWSKERHS